MARYGGLADVRLAAAGPRSVPVAAGAPHLLLIHHRNVKFMV